MCLGCIVADRIGLGAIIREKIDFGAIDHTRVADGGLLGNNIIPGGIGTPQLASQAITNDKLGPNAITSDKIDAGAIANIHLQDTAVTKVYRGTTVTNVTDLYNFSSDTLDIIKDGANFGRPALPSLDGGYIISVKRGGTATPTEFLFKKAATTDPDTLDGVPNGTIYGRVAAASITDGYVSAVKRTGLNESVDNLFKKSSDTFASVAGTLSDGQLGSNVVNTSNIKNANVTTAKMADLAITSDKLDNGISLSAHDEETVAGISSRATATNATKGAWDGATNYIRLTLAVGSTNPQLSTGLATGTSTNLKTTHAIMRYRISGGASGAVTKLEAINTANVAQKSSTVFLADDSWHTAVFDISGWATAGTLRIDLTTSALGSTGYWDVAYIATGIPGGGTGALISNAGNVGVGVASPTSKLHVNGTITIGTTTSTYQAGALGYTDSNWGFIYRPPLAGAIAAHNFEAYDGSDLLTITNSGNVGIGTTSPGGYRLTVNGPAAGTAAAPASLSTPGAAQGERSALALFGTFQSTPGDNAPRRTADVVAGFNGGNWGAEYLSLNVGNNGSSNDTQVLTSEKVRIQSNGNVGIGISAPRTTLHAYGTSNTPSGSGTTEKAIFIVEGSATNAIKMGTDPASPYGSWMQSTDKTNNGIQYPLLLNPVGGKVGINTTAPEEQLEIKTAAAAYGLLHSDGTRKVGSYVDTTGGWYGTKSNHDLHLFTNNGAKRLTVTTGGNIDIASFGTPGSETHVCSDTTGVLVLCSASDERKKEKIETLPAALRMVLQLRPVRYEWKDKGRMGKGQDVGFIAQEVMPLFPELVGLNSDGTYLLHYDKFAPILVSAIQELYDDRAWLARRVQALEDKAEAAEKRLSDLEARLARLEAKQ